MFQLIDFGGHVLDQPAAIVTNLPKSGNKFVIEEGDALLVLLLHLSDNNISSNCKLDGSSHRLSTAYLMDKRRH